jgi:SpoIID/LytB domain protein
MTGRSRSAALSLVVFAWLSSDLSLTGQSKPPPSASPAYRIIELPSGRTLASSREDLLRTPVLPGSILKIATLIAALESSVIGPETRMACPRHVVIDGRRFTCSHPDVGRPMGPAEALAHSCNGYFASVAARVRREDLDRALAQLGLPPTSLSVPLVAAALGLEGTRMSAEQLLAAFVKATSGSLRIRDETRRVLLDGLRGAADYGTASVFRERGLRALAKTGTAPMSGGRYEGLVVAATPADRPTRAVVVMAPGAAGADAARIAADALVLQTVVRSASRGPGEETTLPPGGAGSRVVQVGRARPDGRYDVVSMALEDYVSRVVSAESAPSSGIEARKALAIVARTFALRNRSRHQREGFDVCDLTHCQVVGGRTGAGDEAAKATDGRALFFAGQLADVYYTASCGGHSERAAAVWPGAAELPYLPARPEPECRENASWEIEISARELQRALLTAGRHGQVLRELTVVGWTGSGRVARLRIDGFDPGEIAGEDFRLAVGRVLGWQLLKSTLFDLERTGSGYRFRGRGRGHGVGLCVVGSARMATQGDMAAVILNRYFPGTEVRGSAESGAVADRRVRLDIIVPAGEERERDRIAGLGRAALLEFSEKIGVAVPAYVQLVFHPTVEAYTRASRQPWWTTGATRGARVDLLPLSVLRERGVLEETVRHELAHVISGERLTGRPIWVREAVAMDLAGDLQSAPASILSCPTDAEWLSIRSAAALRSAYRRAGACFSAQRAAGRRWDEVR